jgi:hypothetical protein
MDRRQLLFGATALGLVTDLNLNHPLIAQVGEATMGSSRLSDRERAGLRGPVKTCSDFTGNDAQSVSEAEYSADGRLLVWRGRIFPSGSRAERVYSYDRMGKLIGITGGGADRTDEFHYDEEGKKIRVRTVPPRPGQHSFMVTGAREISMGEMIMFEAAEEGYCLNGGGSITTRYNDDDQPIESVVRDAHGELLAQIAHYYTNGRLISETLVWENLEVPEQFREQLSEEQRRAIPAQMKQALSQLGFRSVERSYVYDDDGHVIRLLTRAGNLHQGRTFTYNEHGDEAGMVITESGSAYQSLDPRNSEGLLSRWVYLYQYDSHGNWIEKSFKIWIEEIKKTADGSSAPTRRKLTYC